VTTIIQPADGNRVNKIRLPPIPVPLDTTHADTAPRLPMIRRPVGPAHGAALRAKAQPRISAFIEAIREARDEMGVGE
jgi:hypothetical protein